jgi:hypothetical protein
MFTGMLNISPDYGMIGGIKAMDKGSGRAAGAGRTGEAPGPAMDSLRLNAC